jgi:hypothetical protein
MSTANIVRPWLRRLALGGAALLALSIPPSATSSRAAGQALALPEFKHQTADAWINSPPLTAANLRGKVVLLEVYTSG